MKLVARMMAWLNPRVCTRCGLTWSALPRGRGDSGLAAREPCPCCNFNGPQRQHTQ